ncbi:hypothetical protein L1887_32574 [Cichorium endivia]|nr:hypothetical protein L1887_32574 [Cichorium endivia]
MGRCICVCDADYGITCNRESRSGDGISDFDLQMAKGEGNDIIGEVIKWIGDEGKQQDILCLMCADTGGVVDTKRIFGIIVVSKEHFVSKEVRKGRQAQISDLRSHLQIRDLHRGTVIDQTQKPTYQVLIQPVRSTGST